LHYSIRIIQNSKLASNSIHSSVFPAFAPCVEKQLPALNVVVSPFEDKKVTPAYAGMTSILLSYK